MFLGLLVDVLTWLRLFGSKLDRDAAKPRALTLPSGDRGRKKELEL